ncbi:hypothetical protein [Corallococcus sp. RDP092CA]|uniref:hypothetical protein n=1 Tax=Corallococcus sp. RDP092CA TaxID=3109369 RepID=UPI0035B442D6
MKDIRTWRFEQYREVDRGNPDAWKDVDVDPLTGARHYMGAADHRPFVQRCELIPPPGFDPAAAPLVFLPYFGEEKPATTLGAYFQAQAAGGDALRELLPRGLDAYLRHDERESRPYFSTLFEPMSMAGHLLVVWYGDQWYVNDVFYRLEGLDGFQDQPYADVVEGTLEDFLRRSPLVQPRLNEGFSRLDHPQRRSRTDFRPDAVVLELEKSPGPPGTRPFSLKVFADGRFELRRADGPVVQGSDVHQLTTLLIAAPSLAARDSWWKLDALATLNLGFDEQRTTLCIDLDGQQTGLTLDKETPYHVQHFVQRVATAYGIEL